MNETLDLIDLTCYLAHAAHHYRFTPRRPSPAPALLLRGGSRFLGGPIARATVGEYLWGVSRTRGTARSGRGGNIFLLPLILCAAECAPKGKETVGEFKKRLRLVALRTPAKDIKEAFDNIKPRCAAIIEAKGRDIHMD